MYFLFEIFMGVNFIKLKAWFFSHKFVAYIIAYSSGLFFSSNKQILSKFLI